MGTKSVRTDAQNFSAHTTAVGRTLITGGAGLVGSTIADLLAQSGHRDVLVVDNLSRGKVENVAHLVERGVVRLVEGDIRDRDLLAGLMDGVDVVFHQAAILIQQCAQDSRTALEVLVDGTYNVLEAAVAANVHKVVAASSASVYGLADTFPTKEGHHPYNNRTFYGAAKAFNEAMLRSFHGMYGLDYVALRYFNVYGPRMDTHTAYTEVLVRWMERIERGEPPIIFGDGTQTMDFVYSEDIARANILAAYSDASDAVFNVGSGVETSLSTLAEVLLRVMGSPLKPVYAPERKVNPVPRRLADVSAAKAALGFTAEVSLEEGLRRLVDWWRGQAPMWEQQ